ncbi:ATP-grasp domain-containing protein [Candidatus Woesebacteria bacterium]|nr:ATP-grasp domain-containing protein [Candidatus Woesebacteria bacterium]QQG47447.1 MAG: ATP-grasp domain-containing protein [Candidatus Woesebacteria bacterium]
MKISSILGLNARSQLYLYKYNSRVGKRIADSKLQMYRVLKRAKIPTPMVYKRFKSLADITDFSWEKLPSSFVLKPSRGFGGEGIVVIKRKARDGNGWVTTQKERVTVEDLKLKVVDILEGAYSLGNVPDVAFIQEYVGRHKAFLRYAYRGTPDIRVIVFNKIPVMAMLRLPTKESGGRANLHQGAVAVGIDIATGITTRAIYHGNPIIYKPDTKRKLNGIKIPQWNKILDLASKTAEACGLGYVGVDIILHPTDGPMILELNARPGLQIQLANMAGLKKRLDRVEDLEVRDSEHAVKIAKAIFGERFGNRVIPDDGIKTINTWEKIKVVSNSSKKHEMIAKIDTGAWRTSMDRDLAKKLGLVTKENILWSKKVKSGLGKENRTVINLTFYLAGRKIVTIASLANRSNLRSQIIIGRRDLSGFLVSPKQIDKSADWYQKLWSHKQV